MPLVEEFPLPVGTGAGKVKNDVGVGKVKSDVISTVLVNSGMEEELVEDGTEEELLYAHASSSRKPGRTRYRASMMAARRQNE